jgi:hypothetical protein
MEVNGIEDSGTGSGASSAVPLEDAREVYDEDAYEGLSRNKFLRRALSIP